ncbi:hypothetical protein CUMW_251720 [Citrus unshiu]|uniref:Uncharacterized protein n=1 Tax=Citrus unshiu TaxID=55188 RepID=A0A2H5QQA7_CITUN|nr:hypothetical protein CUMW_251720 [Citrus unshiu]
MIKEKIADGLLQLQGKEQDAYFHLLPYHDDQLLLFLEAEINRVLVRRALLDTSSSINIILKTILEIAKILVVLEIAKIPIKNIYGPKVTISGFGNLTL